MTASPAPVSRPNQAHAHFNLFVLGHGYHESSWVVSPKGADGLLGLDHYIDVAQIAERGFIDSLFFADAPGVSEFRTWFMAQSGYDPIDLLAALVPVTEHIGLLATASTTYSSPWDLARRFATLDHLSKGRAGWNIVTTGSPAAAANFSDRKHPEHADRYERAAEFVEVVLKVWDGWNDDAVLSDVATGRWADRRKLHPPRHHGEHYTVAGILGLPRAPQGYPVLAQAGSSDAGVDLAGRFADVVFTPQSSLAGGQAFRKRLHAAAAHHGRSPDSIRALPGLSFVLGSTEAQAKAGWDQLEAASTEEFRLYNLLNIAGLDPALADDLDPDGPFPYALFEQAPGQTFGAAVNRVAREGDLTFRQTAQKFATLPGGLHFTGTPVGLADLITEWWTEGGADGFTLQPLRLPLDLALFVDHVIPILQERGIAQREYRPGTLRDRLGIPRPANANALVSR